MKNKIQIVFVSNFYNHHQSPFSEIMYELTDHNYIFIETSRMSDERKRLGYQEQKQIPFVKNILNSEEEKNECQSLINKADVVIYGSGIYSMILPRLKSRKLTFVYSERIYKKGFKWYEQPLRAVKYYIEKGRYTSLYLLCSSAYTSSDYSKTFNFKNKAYKWGYFPEFIRYKNIDEIISKKEKRSILWVGRMINWKHLELAIEVAKKLKFEKVGFDFNIIGTGKLESEYQKMIIDNSLDDCVHMLGSMNPAEVRKYMEKSQIYLFTSDFNEGWGAVLNESMNSGCTVVASHAIGSVPYLIKDKQNGLIYKNGDFEDFYKKVKFLLNNEEECAKLGSKAYKTLEEKWNADVAAERLLVLMKEIQNHGYCDLFKDGPCSRAEILKNNWYNIL